MSKGSWYRKVDQKKWDAGWEKAFGKEKKDVELRPDVREDDDGCNGDEEAVSDHTDRGSGVQNETTDGGR